MTALASHGPLSVSLAVVAVLLTAAAGFCVFDTDSDDHDGVGLDLCTSILVVTLGTVLFVALGLVGTMTERLSWAATPVAVSIPDPPPWR
jgi:hypothetical protein